MGKHRSKYDKYDNTYEEPEIFVKNTSKRKSNQYDKCKNYDCDDNNDGFCLRYKDRAKHACKKYR